MSDKVIVLRGRLDWAKVLGPARPYTGNPKFDKGPYWSVDLTPDKKSLELMKQVGIIDKLREPKGEKETRTEDFLSLTVLENRADGTKNDPPVVKDVTGQNWPDNKLLGNGTIGDVKIKVKDYGKAVKKGTYLQAIRVLEHVPYEVEEFEALSEDDEYFAKANTKVAEDMLPGAPSTAFDPDLDDEVPF